MFVCILRYIVIAIVIIISIINISLLFCFMYICLGLLYLESLPRTDRFGVSAASPSPRL